MPEGNCLAAAAGCEISSRASAAEVAARPALLLMKPARHGSPLLVGVFGRTLTSPIRLSDRAVVVTSRYQDYAAAAAAETLSGAMR